MENVIATDLNGLTTPIQLANMVVEERHAQGKVVFRFIVRPRRDWESRTIFERASIRCSPLQPIAPMFTWPNHSIDFRSGQETGRLLTGADPAKKAKK